MTVGEYLKAPRSNWDWINLDCCRWVDRWVQECGYLSPMRAIGCRYDSERSALLTIARGGGLAALWSRGMAAIGIDICTTPEPGAVAVLRIATDDAHGEACGIWTGSRWAMLHKAGLYVGDAAAIKIWNV